MVTELKGKGLKRAADLFGGWDDTMIWSCLEGEMGRAYAVLRHEERKRKSLGEKPYIASAKLDIADFCFYGGEASEELVLHSKDIYEAGFKILVPQNRDWELLIERIYGDRAVRRVRYAFQKDRNCFSIEELVKMATRLEEGFSIEEIGERTFREAAGLPWACDWGGQFKGYRDYKNRGIGVAVRYKGELVAGASSYTVYSGGIEIQIDTRKDYRNRGLASSCGAALILKCLERGLYPSWDADNEISAHLARRLGYRFEREYPVYKIGLT